MHLSKKVARRIRAQASCPHMQTVDYSNSNSVDLTVSTAQDPRTVVQVPSNRPHHSKKILPHLWDLAEVEVCGDAVDDCVAAGWCNKLHAVAAGVVQAACPVVHLHTCDDRIVSLAGVN